MFKKRNIKKTELVSVKRKIDDEANNEESLLKESTNKLKKSKTTTSGTLTKNIPSRETTYENGMGDDKLTNKDLATVDTTKPKTTGPLKSLPVNIRTTTITDFQPDVCKDFQQTGYCGYGDTCKFLHIRGETKNNKPIVKEWETVKNITKKEPLPFKCVLCKEDYKSPVKTECQHIFCKECFFQRIKNNKNNCFICKQNTNGICSPVSATELEKLINS